MRFLISLVSIGALLGVAGCGDDSPAPGPTPTPASVPPPDMATAPTPGPTFPMTAAVINGPNNTLTYAPSSVDIAAGGTVTWTWGGTISHTVTSDTGLFDSGVKTTGTFSFTFPTAGTFPYHCTVHGFVQSGTVIVH
jgi:plastocyanin